MQVRCGYRFVVGSHLREGEGGVDVVGGLLLGRLCLASAVELFMESSSCRPIRFAHSLVLDRGGRG